MNVTLKLRIRCSPETERILKETVIQFTAAFNRATKQAFHARTTNGITIHRMRYDEERGMTQLPSQLVCAMISKAAEALTSVRALQKKRNLLVKKFPKDWKPKTFKCPQSYRQAIRYDGKRASTVRLKEGWATLASVDGRQEVRFVIPPNFNRYAEWKACVSELVWDKKDRLFLHVVLDGEGKAFVPTGFNVGVDLGICRPAVMSTADGSFNRFLGKREWRAIEKRKYDYRRILEAKGTKPAKRRLKKLSGKVNRFRTDCDHVLSKQIVGSVPTGTTLVFENLKDIRDKCGRKKGKVQNRRIHRWSFARLFEFVDYKARLAGIRVEKVDPRNTSRRCPRCGHVRKSNRRSQSLFKCHACSYSLNADLVGARNVVLKLPPSACPTGDGCQINQPIVARTLSDKPPALAGGR